MHYYHAVATMLYTRATMLLVHYRETRTDIAHQTVCVAAPDAASVHCGVALSAPKTVVYSICASICAVRRQFCNVNYGDRGSFARMAISFAVHTLTRRKLKPKLSALTTQASGRHGQWPRPGFPGPRETIATATHMPSFYSFGDQGVG